MTSMTGFGRGAVAHGGNRFLAEVKSVNNRFCEVRVHAPKDFLEMEHDLAEMIRKQFGRGKFEVFLKMEGSRNSETKSWEANVVRRWKELEKVRKKVGLKNPVAIEHVVGLLPREENHALPAHSATHFLKAAQTALVNLASFRNREGKILSKDIEKRAKSLDITLTKIAQRLAVSEPNRKKELRKRIEQLIHGLEVDSSRLEFEVALLIQKGDVTEEITRLGSHLSKLFELIRSTENVGRSLDFLLQEIQREVNTIGAKATEVEVSGYILYMKSEIEKIREQIQNIE